MRTHKGWTDESDPVNAVDEQLNRAGGNHDPSPVGGPSAEPGIRSSANLAPRVIAGGCYARPAHRRIVEKHPARGRVEVLVLVGARGPDEGRHCDGGDDERDGNRDRQQRQRSPPGPSTASKRGILSATAVTVSPLSGIMIAATSGLMVPVAASTAPTTL